VPIDYDPLLAKVIGYGTDRQQAIMRLERSLSEYFAAGIKTNISLFQRILRDDDFRAGKLDTGFLDRLLARGHSESATYAPEPRIAAIAASMFAALDPASATASDGNSSAPISSPWKQKGRSEALH
jgi:acetyl-CoA carboxylase biotin carboxylase subunit